jgi:hypothetical protein
MHGLSTKVGLIDSVTTVRPVVKSLGWPIGLSPVSAEQITLHLVSEGS